MKLTRRHFIKGSAACAAIAMAGLPAGRLLADTAVQYHRAQCRFCGTGCTVLAGIRDGRMVSVKGDPDSPINAGHLCVKGFALPHIMYGEDRLTNPLVRQPDGSYKAVSWDAALDLVADRFASLVKEHGPDAVAWYGSGQNTTQEAFAANKLFKGIIGTANVEGNPRLCMASAVGGYLNTFGADEPAGGYDDFDACEVFFIIGSNMSECHPMLFRRVIDRKRAHPDKVRIIVADPRATPTARHADLHLQFAPGFDMYLLNAMAQVIVAEKLVDREHLQHCTFRVGLQAGGEFIDLAAFAKFLEDYTPEKVAEKTGVPAADIRQAARWIGAKESPAMTLWTMGINERTKGVQLNCQISNLNLLTGKINKPGCDALSLTGQPNACGGTREQGGLTHLLPGHRAIDNPKHREQIAEIWGVPVERLPVAPSAHAIKMFMNLADKKIQAIWINTTNPAQSLPNAEKYRQAMHEAFTVVSDVYPTRTTRYASVILPSAMWIEKEGVMGQTDRRSQFIPKAVEPPGEARPDFWQIREVAARIARRLDRKTMHRAVDPETGARSVAKAVYGLGFATEKEAWDEYRLTTRHQDVDLWGATYEKLQGHAGGVAWPCPSTEFDNRGSAKRYISEAYAREIFKASRRSYKTGWVTLYDQHMAEKGLPGPVNYYGGHPFKKEAGGKAIIRVLAAGLDKEMPDREYPLVLNTGRVVEHWHTGTMTMRVKMLREMNPGAYVEISARDAKELGLANGAEVRLTSRRGRIALPAWITDRARPGMVFVPFFDENRLINTLTIDDLESLSGAFEPDYKVCAIRMEKA